MILQKIKTLALVFLIAVIIAPLGVSSHEGEVPSQKTTEDVISAYRRYKETVQIAVPVPTVVEVPFGEEFLERLDFAVLDVSKNTFEPYFLKRETFTNQISVSANATSALNGTENMLDGRSQTYTEFILPEEGQGKTIINLFGDQPITSSSLSLLLDSYVAMPTSIEIRANTQTGNKIVVATRGITQSTIQFPRTTASQWTITLAYSQPLRIAELKLLQENATRTSSNAIRFLAQPDHSYRIYFDSDRLVVPSVGEAGNLSGDQDVLRISSLVSQDNPSYALGDYDADSIPDIRDNCVAVANPNQEDMNNNKRGDACDDFDRDGVLNSVDKCPDIPDRNQIDTDNDGIGDVCDSQESRITERYAWIPWVGMGFAGIVLVVLFGLVVYSMRKRQ